MIEHVAVVVPAADEQERIAACLEALEDAARVLRDTTDVTVDVTVVLDCCHDWTAEIVACFPDVRSVVSTARCVGVARRVGTDAALAGKRRLERVWTAHTDADSQVPSHWLAHMVDAAEGGADLVLGTVTPSLELPRPTRRAWQDLHSTLDGHSHIHGANLGIRATTLQLLGGWQPLATGEDVDLVARALAAGVHLRRDGAIPVHTSARLVGRAPQGFSSYLRALPASDMPVG
jgi:hypothetical protein